MGGHGHGHGHHEPPYVVPKPEIYRVEDAPELMKLQADLAKIGLKDPWARNNAWRFHPKYGTVWTRMAQHFWRGVPTGLALFGLTLAVENYLGIDYHPWLHHDNHGEHEKSEH
ncbi:NADH dehydrogenase [ubiquinone] 1 beta subcomplex subunit 3 [Aphidius gifuensis]|uniref:NADH dehydrogenase [ubiquinone] 1 beta subcomplex subunit 3 n=1 Tax=Aphidius gifuensis TaxID=684658 RepID=UPI001CDBDE85|nr:NADH dehydrogenase [ubiquinone] 1 beta subcomplex subunit 3 [Aphidius gifuensis]XP_044009129.1 NADH dehydrogenase [ubiquinone] 1 beta subcomplex subunit 3 [Aphidius gifuensis]